ncbi:hypothetical protein RF55_26534, partial [Lasius niger]
MRAGRIVAVHFNCVRRNKKSSFIDANPEMNRVHGYPDEGHVVEHERRVWNQGVLNVIKGKAKSCPSVGQGSEELCRAFSAESPNRDIPVAKISRLCWWKSKG